MPALLTRKAAADYLGVSVRTLDRHTRDGLIRSVSRGRGCKRQYRESDLAQYISKYAHYER